MLSSPGGSELEDVEDALVDGDVAYRRGTAAAALRHRDFRIVYAGTFSSNVGTWMQNVILGEYALQLTHSRFFVGLLFFGQLGPLDHQRRSRDGAELHRSKLLKRVDQAIGRVSHDRTNREGRREERDKRRVRHCDRPFVQTEDAV